MSIQSNKIYKVGIAGTGMKVPQKVLSNDDLEKLVDTNDEWIMTRTGISERRIISDGIMPSDLATDAAKQALNNAGLTPEDVDCIVACTVTADNRFPTAACHIQRKLNAVNAGAFDVGAACSGFIYGMTVGWNLVSSGLYKNVVVIGVEALSTIVDYTDRNSCVLFGDGAGAVVLQRDCENGRLIQASLGAKGDGDGIMILPAGGSAMPASIETVKNRQHYIHLRGREVFRFAVLKMVELIKNAAEEIGIETKDIGYIVPHQVNIRILESAMEKLDLPMDKVMLNIHKYGNTSAASVAMALHEAITEKRIKKGDKVVMVAFGAGLTWGSCVFEW